MGGKGGGGSKGWGHMLGSHCHSHVLGPGRCSRMLVLGPHPFIVCHVRFAFVGHLWPCGW